jgi:hypothetical protein
MSTFLKPGKKLRELTETPTVLGAAVSTALHGLREKDLLELIVAYSNCAGSADQSSLAELLLRALGEIHIKGEPTEQQIETIQKASQELQKSQPKFRAAITWLCSPRNSKPKASPSLKRFGSGKVEWGRYPLLDKTSEAFTRYFENHGLKHFKSRLSLQEGRLLLVPRLVHLVDLFCACILNRCIGRESSEMAIKICPRCRKFVSSGRKEYCSKDCQWKHYWTPERRADDKWVKDLEKFAKACKPKYGRSLENLQEKLASPKVADRLKSIKLTIENEHWAGWKKIAKRIEGIGKLATESNKN